MADRLAVALQAWQTELERLLSSSEEGPRAEGGASSRRLYFRIQNCMDVEQDTGKISFMKLPRNTIINIPLVATVVAQVPLDKENNFFEIEVLTRPADGGSLVIGLVDRTFGYRAQPGHRKRSIGLQLNDLSVWKNGARTDGPMSGQQLAVGDRIGCGVEDKDGSVQMYFTRNGNRISEGIQCEGSRTPDSAQAVWFPAITTMSQQDQVRLVTESAWRSARKQDVPTGRDVMKINKATGQLIFRSTVKKNQEHKTRSCSLLTSRPFTTSFTFFEVEVIALGKGDEICVGVGAPDHPRNHLPGSVSPKSVGYRGRLGAVCRGDGNKGSRKISRAHEAAVGDKVGCGIDQRTGGRWAIYFTHNSETFHEVSVNSLSRDQLYPAIGLKSAGGSAVCVCIQDVTHWLDAKGLEEDEDSKAAHVDMKLATKTLPTDVKVNKESARATFQSELGLLNDGLLVASQPFSTDLGHFDIEIAYGTHITVGVVSGEFERKTHPGFSQSSIGYNIGEGLVYTNGKPTSVSSGQKKLTSNYGDRIRCGLRPETSSDGKMKVYFEKNGELICETEFQVDSTKLEQSSIPAVAAAAADTATAAAPDTAAAAAATDSSDADTATIAAAAGNTAAAIASNSTLSATAATGDGIVDTIAATATTATSVDVTEDAAAAAISVNATEDTAAAATSVNATEDSAAAATSDATGDAAAATSVDATGDAAAAATSAAVTSNSTAAAAAACKTSGRVQLFAAVGMRSAGQQLSVILLDRDLWGCQPSRKPDSVKNMGAVGDAEGQMSSQQTEEMVKLMDRELIECPICREVFTDPRIFPCSVHSFCAGCLREYVGLKKSVTCPVCRKNCTIPQGGPLKLPCNPYLAKLIELFKASGRN